MTWSERRIITILSTILALLCAALLIILGIRYQKNRDTDQANTPVLSGSEEQAKEVSPFISLTYYNGSATLSFALDEETGKWVWSDDPGFPLDTATLSSILAILGNWNPQQTITDADVIADSGMDDPIGTLSAATADGTFTITFGKATTDGTSHYIRLNEDESTVYIIDGSLYELMRTPIYDMCTLPVLPELSEENIRSVIIRGATSADGTLGLSTSLTAQRAEGEITATWRSGGANVTSDPMVRDLLEDLSAIVFEKCVLYRPSEEAVSLCGFDTPTMLYISYITDTGDEALLELQIGAHLPDESGRYVRMAEESTIYFLPTALLDPLMHISVLGLEG